MPPLRSQLCSCLTEGNTCSPLSCARGCPFSSSNRVQARNDSFLLTNLNKQNTVLLEENNPDHVSYYSQHAVVEVIRAQDSLPLVELFSPFCNTINTIVQLHPTLGLSSVLLLSCAFSFSVLRRVRVCLIFCFSLFFVCVCVCVCVFVCTNCLFL